MGNIGVEVVRKIIDHLNKDINGNKVNLFDVGAAPSLLIFLRKVGLATKDNNARRTVKSFFEVLGKESTLQLSHMLNLEVAKALVAYKDYELALAKLRDAKMVENYPDICDKTIRILNTIPSVASRERLSAFADNKKVPAWVREYALRSMDRLNGIIRGPVQAMAPIEGLAAFIGGLAGSVFSFMLWIGRFVAGAVRIFKDLKLRKGKEDKPRIMLGIPVPARPFAYNESQRTILLKSVSKVSRSLPEEFIVEYFPEQGDARKNLDYLNGIRKEKGADFAVPIEMNFVNDVMSAIPGIDIELKEFLTEMSRVFFQLANPDIAKLDETRTHLMNPEELKQIQKRLSKALPPLAAQRLLELDIYNTRMENVAKKLAIQELSVEAKAYIGNEGRAKRAISVRADSLGEAKLLAEAHEKRAKIAKRLNVEAIPLKLQIRLTLTTDEKSRFEKNRDELLRLMDIKTDDASYPIDIVVVDAADSDRAIERISAQFRDEYKLGNAAIVDSVKADRTAIPRGVLFIEYEDEFVTSYHYDAAIELMANPDEPKWSERFKDWFKIKPMERIDINQLRREIEHYEKVLTAA